MTRRPQRPRRLSLRSKPRILGGVPLQGGVVFLSPPEETVGRGCGA
jgi:hypothetical protein